MLRARDKANAQATIDDVTEVWIVFTALSAAVGVVSGVIPARSAAALDPVEALRYE